MNLGQFFLMVAKFRNYATIIPEARPLTLVDNFLEHGIK